MNNRYHFLIKIDSLSITIFFNIPKCVLYVMMLYKCIKAHLLEAVSVYWLFFYLIANKANHCNLLTTFTYLIMLQFFKKENAKKW